MPIWYFYEVHAVASKKCNCSVINNTNTSKGVGVSTAWPRGNATAGELLEMKAVQTELSDINSHVILMFCKMLLIIDSKYSSYK